MAESEQSESELSESEWSESEWSDATVGNANPSPAEKAALVELVTALPDLAFVHAHAWQLNASMPPLCADAVPDEWAAAGAIEAACASLTRHANDAHVTTCACHALQNLMFDHPANQARAAGAGAAVMLVSTLASAVTKWPESFP